MAADQHSKDTPELSSVSTQLDALVERVSAAAQSCAFTGDEAGAADLYEVERSLRGAARRLHVLLRRRQ